MRIYVAHPSDINYTNELYKPLRDDNFFLQHTLILPHEESGRIINHRDDYKNVDIVVAECSKASTGVGIELGWFYDEEKPIYCFYKSGAQPSSAISAVAQKVIEYTDSNDLLYKIKEIIEER